MEVADNGIEEDNDLIEIRGDKGGTVSVLFVTQALFILSVPFILAFFMAFIAVEQKPYGNFFTHWLTIMIAGCIMCVLFFFLLNKYKART